MRVLYVSQYFPPETCAPAARVSELSKHWVSMGHQVAVLTGFPNHPAGVVPPEWRPKFRRLVYREVIDNVPVVRTWLLPAPNRKPFERLVNYVSFALSSSAVGSFLPGSDVVIATSPQLFVGLTGWWLTRLWGVPLVFEVRDVWPESIVASGMSRDGSLGIEALRRLARFLYRASDHIVAVTPAIGDALVAQGVPRDKVSVVENGVEVDQFSPRARTEDAAGRPCANNGFVVSFIGTFGLAQGLDTVIRAAELLQRYPGIVFRLVGDGADKSRVVSLAAHLGNVRFGDPQPRDCVPRLISESDVCLVTLRKADVFRTVIPTKMLEFMSCGRPIVSNVDGQARELLESAEAGIFVQPENAAELADAILRLYRDPALCRRLGENGRRYVVSHLSRRATAEKYMTLLQSIVNMRDRRRLRRNR